MEELLLALEKAAKELQETKDRSNEQERILIKEPFKKLVTKVKESNDAAAKIIGNMIRRDAIEFLEREKKLAAEIKSFPTQLFNAFGVYDIKWIQRAINEEPNWYDRINFERKNWEELTKEMNFKTNFKTQNPLYVEYINIQYLEEARQINVTKYEFLLEALKAKIKIIEESLTTENNNEELTKRIEKLKQKQVLLKEKILNKTEEEININEIINLLEDDSVTTPLKIKMEKIKSAEIEFELEKKEHQRKKELEEEIIKIQNNKKMSNREKKQLIVTKEEEIKTLDIIMKSIENNRKEIYTSLNLNIHTTNYLEEEIIRRYINPEDFQGQTNDEKLINPKIFTEKKYQNFITDWNKIVNKLLQEQKELQEAKTKKIISWFTILNSIDDNINNTSIIDILNDIYDIDNHKISDEKSKQQYLQQLKEEDKSNQEIINKLKPEIKQLNNDLTEGNKKLNNELNVWIANKENLEQDWKKLHEQALKNVLAGEDDQNIARIKELQNKIVKLTTDLIQLKNELPTNITWFEKLPTVISTTDEKKEKEEQIKAIINHIPWINKDTATILSQNLINSKGTTQESNQNATINIVEQMEIGATIAGHGVNFKLPRLLKVPTMSQAGQANVVVYRDNVVSGKSPNSPKAKSNSVSAPSDQVDGMGKRKNRTDSLSSTTSSGSIKRNISVGTTESKDNLSRRNSEANSSGIEEDMNDLLLEVISEKSNENTPFNSHTSFTTAEEFILGN